MEISDQDAAVITKALIFTIECSHLSVPSRDPDHDVVRPALLTFCQILSKEPFRSFVDMELSTCHWPFTQQMLIDYNASQEPIETYEDWMGILEEINKGREEGNDYGRF